MYEPAEAQQCFLVSFHSSLYRTIYNYLITVPRPLRYDSCRIFFEQVQLHSIYEAAATPQPAVITRDK